MKKVFYLAAIAIVIAGCDKTNEDPTYNRPAEHLTGVPALSGEMDRSKLTMTSVIQGDLDRNIARVPLFKGTYNGSTVWYVRMDVSDAALATSLGLNFAPRLAKLIILAPVVYKL